MVAEACQTADFTAVALALQLIGAVFVPVERNCAAQKVAEFANRVDAAAIILPKEKAELSQSVYTYTQLRSLCYGEERCIVKAPPEKDDICEILFSTGTTGKEKGIVITNGNNTALAENIINGVLMDRDNVEMIPSPLNHSHGLRRFYANMYNGSSVVLLSSVMDIGRFFANIEKHGVNSLDLVPTALAVVLRLSKNKLADYREQLRYIQLGAAPLAEPDKLKLCELLPKTRLYNFYGSTESGCTVIYNFNVAKQKDKCIGKPTANTTLIIVGDDDKPITSSKENCGRIATRGGMNMSGYWQDDAETRAVLKKGTVYSNDIGYIDGDGDVILIGRKGDVINVGGNKVSPDEVENAAKAMSEIADCGCIPVDDAAKGQVPKLFVEMATGEAFDPVCIRKFLSERLEGYKVPTVIVQIEKIPRSYNGKLLRRELKNM